jgi:hypothetical protein
MTLSSDGARIGKEDGDEAFTRALNNFDLKEGELDDVFIDEKDLANMRKEE